MRVEPIRCYRPAPDKAATFASLPYDVFERAQAASYVRDHPGSFLAIDRPETSFSPDHDMYAPDVYAKAAELLRRAATDGTLLHDETPCYYVYRLEQDGRAQTGVVCAASVDEYLDGTIRRHENTRRDKEQDRVEHIRATGAQTGPIFLAYRDNFAMDTLVGLASTAEPLYDFTDEEGVHQTVWRVARPAAVEAMTATFATVPCAYIADGHHRAASAVRVCQEMRLEAARQAGAAGEKDAAPGTEASPAPYDSFLAVMFPASQLKVMAYNRVVTDTAGMAPEQLIERIEAAGFEVGPAQDSPAEPSARHGFGLYVGGAWHAMRFSPEAVASLPADDPVATLDVSILQDRVLGPILGSRTRARTAASALWAASRARRRWSALPARTASRSRSSPRPWTSSWPCPTPGC
jgi:uncharacterized protein (DUF1015 family)